MKRAFIRKDDEAVSPVIAVILMVAITVVLAGVLYVWVTSLSAPSDEEIENIQATLSDGNGNATDGCLFTLEMKKGDIKIADYYISVGKEDTSPKLWTWDVEGNDTSDHPDYGYTIDSGRGGTDATFWSVPEIIGFDNPTGVNRVTGLADNDKVVVKVIRRSDNSEIYVNTFNYRI